MISQKNLVSVTIWITFKKIIIRNPQIEKISPLGHTSKSSFFIRGVGGVFLYMFTFGAFQQRCCQINCFDLSAGYFIVFFYKYALYLLTCTLAKRRHKLTIVDNAILLLLLDMFNIVTFES